uniref:GLIPR1-like protein 1 isoform X1 n=1 Tax=Pogona vitticeps TaxID=103695 RepID=A0A6J0UHA9_9SAUR
MRKNPRRPGRRGAFLARAASCLSVRTAANMGRCCCPWVALGLVVLLGKAHCHNFGPYPDITNKTFIKLYVDAHNKYRSEVKPSAANMRYMTFDIALARIAKAYGKKCIWKHNKNTKIHPDHKFRPFGENLWMGSAGRRPFNPVGAIGSFHSEVKFYDFSSHKCTDVCGHYTQVVWANSYKVGCAVVYCRLVGKSKNMELLVCNYAPAGNYAGVRPYKAGRSCSACPQGDTCQNNLCRNPERDKSNTSYANWYPPYEYEIRCDASCIAVAILRPLLMFITLPVVYYLKLRYPSLSFGI